MKKYAVQIEFSTHLTDTTNVIGYMEKGYPIFSWVDGKSNSFHVVKEMEVEFSSHEELEAYVNVLGGAVYRIYKTEETTMLVYDRKQDTRFC